MFITWRAKRDLAVFLIAMVLMEIVRGIEAMALLPLYLTEVHGSSVALVGAVISTYLIVDIITRTPAGWLADRWGRKTVLLWGIILSMIPLPLMMGVRNAGTFLICIALVFAVFIIVLCLARETRVTGQEPSSLARMKEGFRWVSGELVPLGGIALLLTISLAFLLPIVSLDGAQVLLVDKPTMSIVLAISGGITALILLPAGHLADRVGRKLLGGGRCGPVDGMFCRRPGACS